MDFLPEDLLLEIFHKLPVKSIGLCMCVKKKWLSLMKNPSFISSRTKIKNKKNQYLAIWNSYNQVELRFDNNRFDFYELFDLPINGIDLIDGALVNCHGMICVAELVGTNIMLWNPTIRKLLTLPKPNLIPLESYTQHLGFWFDSLTNDYKLIRILCFFKGRYTRVEIFSLNENSWKVVSDTSCPWFHTHRGPLPILNDTLHWTVHYDSGFQSILGFDVNAKLFRKIELPDVLRGIDIRFTLGLYKETSIAICCDYYNAERGAWVMKEYGNVESWTKVLQFDVTEHPYVLDDMPPDYCAYVIGLLNNGEVLWGLFVYPDGIDEDGYVTIVSIDSVSGELKKHAYVLESYYDLDREVRYFEESLVLLDNVNAVFV